MYVHNLNIKPYTCAEYMILSHGVGGMGGGGVIMALHRKLSD
jgi:hypothetical protein